MFSRWTLTRNTTRFLPLTTRRGLATADRAHDLRWPGWEVVIGIEVHAQIKSRRKLFSEALTQDADNVPNAHVAAFDAAFPGTLPHLNPKCVELAIRTALACESDVQLRSAFDRKHYFYSDLPSGYQITQQYAPIAYGGRLTLAKHGVEVRIKQIQLEQDTAKSTYDARKQLSSIDLSRAGSGLMEIVSEPDMRSPEEAGEYVRTLQAVLRSVGSSDGNMEQGSLRCDVNVSVNRTGDSKGTRCEIKNLNSVKFAQVAITSEVFRQISMLEDGSAVMQETRGFDEDKAETYALRSKEDAPDYRYMPDPNLPPLLLTETYIDSIRQTMPELPAATRERLLLQGLTPRDIDVLMSVDAGREVRFDGELGSGAVAYFDAVAFGRDPKAVVNWITHELLGQLAFRGLTFTGNTISVEQLGELVDLVHSKALTGTSGKTLLRHMLDHPSAIMPSQLAKEHSLLTVANDSVTAWCKQAIDALPEEASVVRAGNLKVLNKIVGRVMQFSRGTVDAKAARAILEKLLRAPP